MVSQPQITSITAQLTKLLSEFDFERTAGQAELVDKAVYLARRLQERSHDLQTPAERRQQAELDRMIQSPHDKATLTQLTDQTFRSRKRSGRPISLSTFSTCRACRDSSARSIARCYAGSSRSVRTCPAWRCRW